MPTSPTESKRALREHIRARRSALRVGDLSAAARAIRDHALETPEIARASSVAAYVSTGREPGTGPLLDALLERGTEVILPLLLPDDDLDWARFEGSDRLVSVSRGLLEPDGEPLGPDAVRMVDVVLAPGLAVDRRGFRLGRGGGSFDRALDRVGPPTWTCVVVHDGEVMDIAVPRERHDRPVAAAITPSGIRRFT